MTLMCMIKNGWQATTYSEAAKIELKELREQTQKLAGLDLDCMNHGPTNVCLCTLKY